jgi:DNA gyrase subunit A
MERITSELLADLDKETVDFYPNYDDTLMQPWVMPTKLPNLLVNGATGIAVGMATNIPPHNLREVIDACLALIGDPSLGIDGLMEHIKGPDFPTGAIINGRVGIIEAYKTGRGRILVRARAEVETDPKTGRESIVVTEIPFQLNKARLIERIAELVKEKKLEGITELRDESDKDGMRIVIEIRRGDQAEVVLNNLYAQTQLQSVFGINCVALVDGQPRTLNLKSMLQRFLEFRREVVLRRSIYLLRQARHRGHIVEGQAVALKNIDPVVELIKTSPDTATAKAKLMERGWQSDVVRALLERAGSDACRPEGLSPQFGFRDGLYYLSDEQAQAILDLRLQRLTTLEQDKLIEDYRKILDEIADLQDILASDARLTTVIKDELREIRDRYGDDRRTEIVSSQLDLSVEDLITEEDVVVTISHQGYAKTQPVTVYQAQRRGGRGKAATAVKDEDFVEHLLIAHSHSTLLCFSDFGKVYWLKVYEIPQGSRGSKGRPLINMLPLDANERITAVLPIKDFAADAFVFMATGNGTVKKTPLDDFSRPRSSGLIALELEPGNTLVDVAITDGHCDVLLLASSGKAARFKESEVRAMGRTARGVRGIRLFGGHRVVGMIIPEEGGYVLTASERGYGKRTEVADFPVKGRGTQGVIAQQTSDRNGPLVAAVQVFDTDDVMLVSDQGTLVRTRVAEISVMGRNTQGVRLIALRDGEKLSGIERIVETENGDAPNGADTDAPDGDATGGQRATGAAEEGVE